MEQLQQGDALIVVDVQNDFLPGGALGISGGDRIVPILTAYIARFQARGCPSLSREIGILPTIVHFFRREVPGRRIAWQAHPVRSPGELSAATFGRAHL